MSFYDLNKEERKKVVNQIYDELLDDLRSSTTNKHLVYFSDEDTYIRKTAYLAVGKLYKQEEQDKIRKNLEVFLGHTNEKVRQTTINAAGEIGKTDFDKVVSFFDKGLLDEHHSVRNAVIGSLKKMVEKNPEPVLQWVKPYLHHRDAEIRREVCHGIELRGRTHPQDVLPLLKELQFEQNNRVKKTLIHVLGQISYKQNCLNIVVQELNSWENKELIKQAVLEIIDVHRRYAKFSSLTQAQAIDYIDKNLKK